MAYTRLGATVFDWAPYYERSMAARNIWLALYASPQSKKGIPGLFHGGVGALSEAARMGAGPAIEALRELCEAGLAAHDERNRVIRMTQLPDKLEKPSNGKVLKMFWNRWKDFPESELKYHHIATVHWLCEELLSNTMKREHWATWDMTFGTIPVDKWSSSVDKSLTVTGTVAGTVRMPQQDLFSGTSDANLTVTDTVSLTVEEKHKEQRAKSKVLVEGVEGGARPAPSAPRAALPPSLTIEDILDALQRTAAHRIAVEIYDERIGERLWALAEQCDRQGVKVPDIELAGKWLAAGGLGYRDDLDAKWLSYEGNLIGLVAQAKKWIAAGQPALGRTKKQDGQSNFDKQAERLRLLRAAEAR
jgi:hypothetical protein